MTKSFINQSGPNAPAIIFDEKYFVTLYNYFLKYIPNSVAENRTNNYFEKSYVAQMPNHKRINNYFRRKNSRAKSIPPLSSQSHLRSVSSPTPRPPSSLFSSRFLYYLLQHSRAECLVSSLSQHCNAQLILYSHVTASSTFWDLVTDLFRCESRSRWAECPPTVTQMLLYSFVNINIILYTPTNSSE